jgi:integrase
MVVDVLKPIWGTKTDTATKLRGRIEMVFDWARTKKFRTGENPARWKGHLSNLLAAPEQVRERGHFAALPYSRMASFMPKLRTMDGIAAQALQFTILTVARSNMVRGAKWAEIDWKNKIWTCPAERMKGKKGQRKEQRTPLSDAAIAILKERHKAKDGLYIFPGRDGGAMSDMSLTAVLRRMKRKDADVHGFRSTFSDWAHETTQHDNHTIELALAHKVGTAVERAYRRGDMFKKRVALMDDWAKFCGA